MFGNRTLIEVTLVILFGLSGVSFAKDSQRLDPEPVSSLDLKQYMGEWHQIAAIPASFQEQCYRDTTAEYSLLENGLIEVINSCTREDGARESSEGRARINPRFESASRLEVTFVRLTDWLWALAGEYWVIGLEPNYQYSIVGHPQHENAWILSRSPSLSQETLKAIMDQLEVKGYDPCRLIMSRTPAQDFESLPTLCEYLDEPEALKE